jgi:outer membrane lipoprotein SlyB
MVFAPRVYRARLRSLKFSRKGRRMRNPTRILAASLALALTLMPALATAAGNLSGEEQQAPQSVGALERGYRTGYSDGYQTGYRDSADKAARDYRNKDEYQRADRAYATSYGALEDYRDGYQQGFEAGYETGYDRRTFNSTIPANLSRRGTINDNESSSAPSSSSTSGTSGNVSNNGNSGSSSSSSSSGPISPANVSYIPSNTELRVELLTNLSTDSTQSGDRFEARVMEPAEYQGAMIEGHVTRVKRAGKIKGNSELQLAFDKISSNNRWTNFKAQVIEVIDSGNSENVGDVDEEGGVKGKSRTKDDVAKIGSTAGVGAIIGAIFGGGKGAAIGAAIGAAVGTGGVLTSSGKDIRLDHGQQLRIRTSTETRF